MALAMKSSAAVSSAARAARPSRATMVVRAEARREVLAGFVAGAAALLAAPKAEAVTPVDLFDDRKVRQSGFDLIYEARDLDLDQATRDGLTQARTDLNATIKRVKESESRIDSAIKPSVDKAYWTEAREELRRQVGTLRFDLNTLASTKPKDAKKDALAARKEFIRAVEDLDFALRKKDKESASSKLVAVQTSLDKALAKVL